jgi:hypothetical protein
MIIYKQKSITTAKGGGKLEGIITKVSIKIN